MQQIGALIFYSDKFQSLHTLPRKLFVGESDCLTALAVIGDFDLSKRQLSFGSQKSYQLLRIFSSKLPFLQKWKYWKGPLSDF